jgi:hypothetical protein
VLKRLFHVLESRETVLDRWVGRPQPPQAARFCVAGWQEVEQVAASSGS